MILSKELNTARTAEKKTPRPLNIDKIECLPNKCVPQRTGSIKFIINNAKLESYSFSAGIGDDALVDLTYSFPDGSQKKGLFMSGNYITSAG